HARPLAPYNFTYSSSASMSLREYLSAFYFTTIALTIPLFSTVDLNSFNSTSLFISFSLIYSIPNHLYGLSLSYLCFTSHFISQKNIQEKYNSILITISSLNTYYNILSFRSIISSTSVNDFSISTCVNSG